MQIDAVIKQLKEAHDALVHTPSPGYASYEDKLQTLITQMESTYAAQQPPVAVPTVQFRGDIGAVKKVLQDAGMLAEFAQFYNDKNVKGRRIKCSNATALWAADAGVLKAVKTALQAAFGARWDSVYFIKQPRYYGRGMQLCIKLHS